MGISAQSTTTSAASKNGAGLAYTTLKAFTFTNAGSTYSVAEAADGTILGTKDGGSWFGQPDTDSGANVALQALTALNTKPASSVAAAVLPPTRSSSTKVNLSA